MSIRSIRSIIVIVMSIMLFVSCMNVPEYVAVNTKSGGYVRGRVVSQDEVELVIEVQISRDVTFSGDNVTIQRKDISSMSKLSTGSSDDDILWYLPLL